MLAWIERGNAAIAAVLWGPPMLVFFLFVGLLFSVKTKFFQLTHFRFWWRSTFGALFDKRTRAHGKQSVSQFQAISAALAATVGTGNIAGVATALTVGGPGAIFWMWVSAFLGMMTAYAENALGIIYRGKDKNGRRIGGAMVYMERGLRCKVFAVLFSVFCILASLGMGNMAQSNAISAALADGFGISPLVSGAVCALLVALVVLGGMRRITTVAEKLVPFMVIAYLLACAVCLFSRFGAIPQAFCSIVTEAFRPAAIGGGVLGFGMRQALRIGISRGVFSNEAGLGSTVAAHAATDCNDPMQMGMWGIFEVFVDTIVVCTLTALVILTSGVYDAQTYAAAIRSGVLLPTGVALTADAFAVTFGTAAAGWIAVSVGLFAFASIIGWNLFGSSCVEYIYGERALPYYRILFVGAVFVGAVTGIELVWNISDTFNALMAVPNLITITLLSHKVRLHNR